MKLWVPEDFRQIVFVMVWDKTTNWLPTNYGSWHQYLKTDCRNDCAQTLYLCNPGSESKFLLLHYEKMKLQSEADGHKVGFKFDPIFRYTGPSPARRLTAYLLISLLCGCQVSWCSSARAVQAAGGSLNLVDFPVSYLQAARCLIWLVYFWLSAFKDTDCERACVCVCERDLKNEWGMDEGNAEKREAVLKSNFKVHSLYYR